MDEWNLWPVKVYVSDLFCFGLSHWRKLCEEQFFIFYNFPMQRVGLGTVARMRIAFLQINFYRRNDSAGVLVFFPAPVIMPGAPHNLELELSQSWQSVIYQDRPRAKDRLTLHWPADRDNNLLKPRQQGLNPCSPSTTGTSLSGVTPVTMRVSWFMWCVVK